MRLLGYDITISKAMAPVAEARSGWWPVVFESFSGAWQRGIEVRATNIQANHAVFACQTLIASDIAKLRVKLMQRSAGIWQEVENSAYSPVLRKPNHYQTRVQFWESWILSKLQRGNTYALKERDARGVVSALYILDPSRVQPLVSDDGSVFYQLQTDNLTGINEPVTVPAREIIHDRWNCLFHPLVGVSPIYASALAATHGLKIQESSVRFFANDATPGGILSAPGRISKESADRLKDVWENKYGGSNRGRIAVLGDGLKFETMSVSPVDAQVVEQMRWSAEVVCSTFHVPPYKVGIADPPKYSNIQALNVEYYSQCLQILIEAAEACIDEGLGMSPNVGVEFDVDGLLRMDSVTQMDVLEKGVKAGVLAPNEGRKKLDLPPKPGGDSPYLQQQNYSLEALAKRDAQQDPFTSAPPAKSIIRVGE